MSEFEKAFAQAHAEGKPLFWWRGKQYTTVRADGKPLPAARDFDAEHALRLEAERQVGELREKYADAGRLFLELQAKLDTAMGVLRDSLKWVEETTFGGDDAIELMGRLRSALNTTSTEGKDHE